MKKLALLLAVIILAFCLCSCGEQDPGKPLVIDYDAMRRNYDNAVMYVNYLLGDAEMTESEQINSEAVDYYHYWTGKASEAIDPAKVSSEFGMDITLDGTKLTVGKFTVKELTALGFNLEYDEKEVDPGTSECFTVMRNNKYCNMSTEYNNSGKPKNFSEMTVCEAEWYSGEYNTGNGYDSANSVQSMDFKYEGLDPSSDLKAVFDSLGVPNYSIGLAANDLNAVIELKYTRTNSDGKNDNLNIMLTYEPTKGAAFIECLTLTKNAE